MNPKTLLFPFTWLPEPHLQAVERHFKRPAVLVPADQDVAPALTGWHDAGRIELRTPFRGDAKHLAQIRRGFQHWADTHQGADRSVAQILEGGIPFFDDSYVARIRSQIRGGAAGAGKTSLDRLTRARLFLQMAEQYDRQRRELESDLEAFQALETAMLSDLRDVGQPERPLDAARALEDADPGRFMAEERIRAWARLYLASETEKETRAVFATTSRAALETLVDAVSGPDDWVEASVSGGVAAVQAAVGAILAGEPAPSPASTRTGATAVSLFFLAGTGPRQLFSRFLEAGAASRAASAESRGTILAWVRTTS